MSNEDRPDDEPVTVQEGSGELEEMHRNADDGPDSRSYHTDEDEGVDLDEGRLDEARAGRAYVNRLLNGEE